MLRAKAIKFKKGEVKAGEKFLASTDVHGSFAGIPVVVQTVNAINRTKFARKQMDSVLGVHPDAWMPELATKRFRWSANKHGSATVVTNGERTPGKVAIFSTCYVNYNEPGIGHDLIKLLEHNDIPYTIVDKESCCGMPKLELGDLDAVEKHKNANIPVLARYAKDGYAILTAMPSCTLMFKQELPLMFPDERRREAGAGRDVRPLRVLHRAPQGRAAEDRFQDRARQGQLPHPLPRPGAEHRQEDRRDVQADRQQGRRCSSTRSSAARAMPAPTA